jgi:L-amino acid N-acyltransferase
MLPFVIRPAESRDLAAIQAIYNPEVQHGFSTWNEQPFDLAYFENMLTHFTAQNFPFFVVEDTEQQKIAGYADYSSFRSFTGYRHTVEHSVYVSPEYAGRGLGKLLLQSLIDYAKQHDVHVMVAGIDHENKVSIHLHEKLGFKHTGYMPQVGKKFGLWRDLVLMQLQFDE